VKRALTDRGELTRLLTQTDVPERRIADLAHKIHDRKERHQDLVSRVDLSAEIITIQIDVSRIVDIPGTVLQHQIPAVVRRRGVETRLVLTEGKSALNDSRVDPALVKAIVRARRWFERLASGRVQTLEEIGRSEQISDRYVGALMPFAFLAPDIVARILDGDPDLVVTAQNRIASVEIPIDWRDQRNLIYQRKVASRRAS